MIYPTVELIVLINSQNIGYGLFDSEENRNTHKVNCDPLLKFKLHKIHSFLSAWIIMKARY